MAVVIDTCQLPDQRAYRPTGGGHHHGLAGSGLAAFQSLLPRIAAVGSALDVLASVTDTSERVSEPKTPEQQAAMQQVNIERGKLYEDLLTLLVKPHAKRAAEAAALRAVFAQVS
ncbi:hypothetical protein SFA35_26110 (plasmid) [Pseudomonas sp. HR96]|nr:hypothetical protein [Pseudomonas sp. HR96]WPP02581.1 hypothetical protein SFA35_26110 [Pseudomonas sp. HR96]